MISRLSRVWQHVKLSDICLGTCSRYSLVVKEDFKNSDEKKSPCPVDLLFN